MSYLVTETVTRTIVVDGRNSADALDNALDYSSQYDWSDTVTSYTVKLVAS